MAFEVEPCQPDRYAGTTDEKRPSIREPADRHLSRLERRHDRRVPSFDGMKEETFALAYDHPLSVRGDRLRDRLLTGNSRLRERPQLDGGHVQHEHAQRTVRMLVRGEKNGLAVGKPARVGNRRDGKAQCPRLPGPCGDDGELRRVFRRSEKGLCSVGGEGERITRAEVPRCRAVHGAKISAEQLSSALSRLEKEQLLTVARELPRDGVVEIGQVAFLFFTWACAANEVAPFVLRDEDTAIARYVMQRQRTRRTQQETVPAVQADRAQRGGLAGLSRAEPDFLAIWGPGKTHRAAEVRRQCSRALAFGGEHEHATGITEERMLDESNVACGRDAWMAEPSGGLVQYVPRRQLESASPLDLANDCEVDPIRLPIGAGDVGEQLARGATDEGSAGERSAAHVVGEVGLLIERECELTRSRYGEYPRGGEIERTRLGMPRNGRVRLGWFALPRRAVHDPFSCRSEACRPRRPLSEGELLERNLGRDAAAQGEYRPHRRTSDHDRESYSQRRCLPGLPEPGRNPLQAKARTRAAAHDRRSAPHVSQRGERGADDRARVHLGSACLCLRQLRTPEVLFELPRGLIPMVGVLGEAPADDP